MARRITAARRYAEAALQMGRADGTLDAWERDLASLGTALRHPELRQLLEHPGIAYADKERVLRRVFGDGVGTQPMRLVLLMIRRGRPGGIGPMIERFGELLRSERGISLAHVRTALPLGDAQREQVAARLRELTGEQVEMDEVVDPGLIGGIAVRIGDKLYDASVRNRLARLRARLTAV